MSGLQPSDEGSNIAMLWHLDSNPLDSELDRCGGRRHTVPAILRKDRSTDKEEADGRHEYLPGKSPFAYEPKDFHRYSFDRIFTKSFGMWPDYLLLDIGRVT